MRYVRRLQLFDFHSCDAVAFHFFDRIAVAIVIESVADARYLLQAREHESSEGFKS